MKKLLLLLLIIPQLYTAPKFKLVQEQSQSAEFHANTSTAFSLLDASPAIINTFGSYKEIKFDWFYKDNKIQDNIAIELQPFWLIFFKHVNYQTYINLPYLVQRLGDTSFSLGQKKVGLNNHFSYALNINLYKQADPINDPKLTKDLKSVFSVREKQIMRELMRKEMMFDMVDASKKSQLQSEIQYLNDQLDNITETELINTAKIIAQYKKNNWNKGFLNVGVGQMLIYNLDNNFILLNSTVAVWIHYGMPIKKIGLLSVLHRYYINDILYNGINVRFGESELKNIFTEILHSINKTDTYYNFNFGGTTIIKKKYMVSLGFKFKFSDKLKLIELTPTYNFNLGF